MDFWCHRGFRLGKTKIAFKDSEQRNTYPNTQDLTYLWAIISDLSFYNALILIYHKTESKPKYL